MKYDTGKDRQGFDGADDWTAQPGDPALDLHLTGLRVAAVVIVPLTDTIEVAITFDTGRAAGFRADPGTGTQARLGMVTHTGIAASFSRCPASLRMVRIAAALLEAWRADGAPVELTMAPGKWTRLHCPGHPAGSTIPLPRTEDTGHSHGR